MSHISGEQIREAAAAHEQTCPKSMKDSFYYGFREGAKWMQHELNHIVEGEMESSELLAYNCEKRGFNNALDRVCEFLKSDLIDCNPFEGSYIDSSHYRSVGELITELRKTITP